jgi:hypothetical protein
MRVTSSALVPQIECGLNIRINERDRSFQLILQSRDVKLLIAGIDNLYIVVKAW